jgi:hypothetical protein
MALSINEHTKANIAGFKYKKGQTEKLGGSWQRTNGRPGWPQISVDLKFRSAAKNGHNATHQAGCLFRGGSCTQNLSNRAYGVVAGGYNPKPELYRALLRSAKSIFFLKKDRQVRAACTHPVVLFYFNWPSSSLKVPYITRIWVSVVE